MYRCYRNRTHPYLLLNAEQSLSLRGSNLSPLDDHDRERSRKSRGRVDTEKSVRIIKSVGINRSTTLLAEFTVHAIITNLDENFIDV